MTNISNMVAIRGATTVEIDSVEEIDAAVKRLYETISEANLIEEKDILYIMFSQTSDLRSRNPAAALRAANLGSNTSLFCSQEPEIDNMMEKVIRIMIVCKSRNSKVMPVYLNRAGKLRPEFAK